jgi:hypothetical protein
LPRALTFALPKPRVRWPRQNHGAASGSRGIFARVKPDKHSPGAEGRGRSRLIFCSCADKRTFSPPLRGGPVGDGVLDVPRLRDSKTCVCYDFMPSCRGDLGSPVFVALQQDYAFIASRHSLAATKPPVRHCGRQTITTAQHRNKRISSNNPFFLIPSATRNPN